MTRRALPTLLAFGLALAGSLDSDQGLQEAALIQKAKSVAAKLPENRSHVLSEATRSSLLAYKENQTPATIAPLVSFKAVVAEFIAMTLFVVIGCGSAMGIAKQPGSAWILQVSLTFGIAITVLAYAIGSYSGGHINCAVTLGLFLAGQVGFAQAVCNVLAQLCGSVAGAAILRVVYKEENDRTGGLAMNAVGEGWSTTQAFNGEFLMTFLLVLVVLETATNPASAANRMMAPLAIGFAVFLAHSVLIPIDGCSINPTRSFGPWLLQKLRYEKPTEASQLVFYAGPLSGAVVAAGVQVALRAGV